MKESVSVGRPKINNLVALNLRVVQEQLDALDRLVIREREARKDPALNRTDLLREALTEYLSEHSEKKRR